MGMLGFRQPVKRAVKVASVLAAAVAASRWWTRITSAVYQSRWVATRARNASRSMASGTWRRMPAIQRRCSSESRPSSSRSASMTLKKSTSSGRRVRTAAISAALPVSFRHSAAVRV